MAGSRGLCIGLVLAGCGRLEFGRLPADSTVEDTTTGGTDATMDCGVTAGLLGHWTLDAADMTAAMARDLSGQGRHGVLVGAPPPATAAGRIGEGIDFIGTSAYVDIPNLPLDATQGAFNSYSIWFWNGNANVDDGLFAVPDGGGPMPPRYDVWLTSVTTSALCINTGTGDCWGVPALDMIGRWVHVVAVFANGPVSGGRLFVDGVDAGASCKFGSCTDERISMSPFRFGGGDPTYPWRGVLDDIRIFNRALTPAEAQQLYACAP